MILGIGSDILDSRRIERLLQLYDQRFLDKVFTPQECTLAPLKNPHLYYAKRFAAKEAFSKAIGTGIGHFCKFHDISITRTTQGPPLILLNDALSMRLLKRYGAKPQTFLSLSDEPPFVLAMVVVSMVPSYST
jgi:holo-[acyl-carrier protein] synthase